MFRTTPYNQATVLSILTRARLARSRVEAILLHAHAKYFNLDFHLEQVHDLNDDILHGSNPLREISTKS